MKKIFIFAILMFLFAIPCMASAQYSKEVLTLKRDLAQEKILRIQAEFQLMSEQMEKMKTQYEQLKSELDNYNKELEKMNEEEKPITSTPDTTPTPPATVDTPADTPSTPTGGVPPVTQPSGGQVTQ